MKIIYISLTVLFISVTSLFAQITQKQANSIVKEYLQKEQIEYELLYVHINLSNENGISITTSMKRFLRQNMLVGHILLLKLNFSTVLFFL